MAQQQQIYSLVTGVGVAQDGTSASLTAPNGKAQEKLLRATLRDAGLSGEEVDYIEAHGTGTPLGDPIEMSALAAVMGEDRDDDHPLVMGAVKANIGHLEPAAGIAGLIKAILVLQHEEAPPNPLLEKINPKIAAVTKDFAVRFPTTLESLRPLVGKTDGEALVAGVSSFGYAGTIAHIIMSEAPKALSKPITSSASKIVDTAVLGKVFFLFTGQGSQYEDMGRGLYDAEPTFKAAMDSCEAVYEDQTGESLLGLIYPDTKAAEGSSSLLDLTKNTQPAIFAVEWSLAEMWRARGVTPAMVLGHSIGEIVAACVAGAMTMEAGLRLAIERGALMQALPAGEGVMVASRCSQADAEGAITELSLGDRAAVASVNGPESVVVAGTEDAVMAVLAKLGKKGAKLSVSHAFHSPLMLPMTDTFRAVLASMEFSACTIPLASTVTGTVVLPGSTIDVEHWVKQVSAPVLYSIAMEKALSFEVSGLPLVSVLLEVGANPVLSSMAKPWVSKQVARPLSWHASLNRKAGVVDAAAVSQAHNALFGISELLGNRKSFPWAPLAHPLLQKLEMIDQSTEAYTAVFHRSLMGLMKDHTIQGRCLFPGAGFVEMALAAELRHLGPRAKGAALHDITFMEPFDLEEGASLVCEVSSDDGLVFRPADDLSRVVCSVGSAGHASGSPSGESLAAVRERCAEEVSGVADRYADLEVREFHGPQFQTLVQVWRSASKDEMVAKLRVPQDGYRYHLHPAVLDGVFQLAGFVDDVSSGNEMKAFVPASIGQVQLHASFGRGEGGAKAQAEWMWAHCRVVETSAKARVMDFTIFDGPGSSVAASLESFRFAQLPPQPPASALYEVRWPEMPLDSVAQVAEKELRVSVLELPGSGTFPWST